jgi:iron(III) transport system ATP-binding protein
MASIHIQDISKRFGSTVALDHLTLDIAGGELFFLLGPSGCGKTTLLRILAGFVPPDAGEIFLEDRRITDLPPRYRDAGMVFQTYALWPHLTVAANVAYGLHVRRLPRSDVAKRVERILKLVRLEGLGGRRPAQLSGGQQQRVALARALVIEPQVLLLDEPLSNLDARLRDEMREEIRRLHQETGLTMVYVTHDQKEALSLADRLAVMDGGRLVQIGRASEVYDRPATRFVARFLGDSNFVAGIVRTSHTGECVVDTGLGPLVGTPVNGRLTPSTAVVCSIRPQALSLDTGGTTVNKIGAKVERVTFFGDVLHLRLLAAGSTYLEMISLPHAVGKLRAGDAVSLTVPPDQVTVLPEPA